MRISCAILFSLVAANISFAAPRIVALQPVESEKFARMLAAPSLVREINSSLLKPAKYQPVLAEYIISGEKKHEAVFGISKQAHFQSGKEIGIEDITASLAHCGIKLKTESVNLDEESLLGVKISGEEGESILSNVSACPIYSAASINGFGSVFGIGTNIAGAGNWQLYKRGVNGSIWLSNENDDQLILNAVHDESHGLSLLRSGEVNALVSKEENTADSARNDQTLLLRECGNYRLIFRQKEEIPCIEDM